MDPVTSTQYESAGIMSLGQVRTLSKVTTGMVGDVPAGLASWMIDGGLQAEVDAIVEKQRRLWLQAHSGLKKIMPIEVGPIPDTSVLSYMAKMREGRMHIVLEGMKDWMGSTNRGGTFSVYLYRLTRSMSDEMLQQLVPFKVWLSHSVNLLQALGLIDTGLLDGCRETQQRIMLYYGPDSDKPSIPTFWRAKPTPEKNEWNLCYKEKEQLIGEFAAGTIIGFRKPIF